MPNADAHGQPPGDETRAFQAYYGNRDDDDVVEEPRSLFYRVFVAWWRDRVQARRTKIPPRQPLGRLSRRIWALVAVVGVLVLGGLGLGIFSSGAGNRSTPSTTVAPVDPADVAAARACDSFVKFLDAATAGSVSQGVFQPFVNDADALVAGAKPGQPAPKWFQLGSELINVGDDLVKDNPQQMKTDATAASKQCSTIPPAAARAGGYTPPGK